MLCVNFHQNQKQLMFFQNILKSKAHDKLTQARKMSRDIKELFEQRFVKVFDQN